MMASDIMKKGGQFLQRYKLDMLDSTIEVSCHYYTLEQVKGCILIHSYVMF